MTKQETRAFLAMHDALQTILMELTDGYTHDAVATRPYDQRHLDERLTLTKRRVLNVARQQLGPGLVASDEAPREPAVQKEPPSALFCGILFEATPRVTTVVRELRMRIHKQPARVDGHTGTTQLQPLPVHVAV